MSIYSNRNYHFMHNKLSEGNPFNYSYLNNYQQKVQPAAQKNPYYPPNNQYNQNQYNQNISQPQNSLSQTAPINKNSL